MILVPKCCSMVLRTLTSDGFRQATSTLLGLGEQAVGGQPGHAGGRGELDRADRTSSSCRSTSLSSSMPDLRLISNSTVWRTPGKSSARCRQRAADRLGRRASAEASCTTGFCGAGRFSITCGDLTDGGGPAGSALATTGLACAATRPLEPPRCEHRGSCRRGGCRGEEGREEAALLGFARRGRRAAGGFGKCGGGIVGKLAGPSGAAALPAAAG